MKKLQDFMIKVTDYIDYLVSLKIHCKVSLRPFATVPSALRVYGGYVHYTFDEFLTARLATV